MPLPIPLLVSAVLAGLGGARLVIKGAVDMFTANDKISEAKERHERNCKRIKRKNLATVKVMDNLGKKEMEVLAGFQEFSDVWEQIHNKPEFKTLDKNGIHITRYSPSKIKEVSVGAAVLLGGLGGAAVGTAGGFAAAGATTAAVMAFGTASTGTTIASLSGVAATNATLAALGGGTIAAGGGGIALGTTVLGISTLGVGLLVGGIIFSFFGNAVLGKANNAYDEMLKAEKIIDDICDHLDDLKMTASKYLDSINKVNACYSKMFRKLKVTIDRTSDWKKFTVEEKLNAENTVLAVGLLYEMCKVKLVLVSKNVSKRNTINYSEIKDVEEKAIAFQKRFMRSPP